MYILLKFMSEKNYLKDFLDGHLYMNSLYYFWNQYILDLAKKNRGFRLIIYFLLKVSWNRITHLHHSIR